MIQSKTEVFQKKSTVYFTDVTSESDHTKRWLFVLQRKYLKFCFGSRKKEKNVNKTLHNVSESCKPSNPVTDVYPKSSSKCISDEEVEYFVTVVTVALCPVVVTEDKKRGEKKEKDTTRGFKES